MDIYVFQGVGNSMLGIISEYQSVIWTTQYYGQDEFQLVVNASNENLDLLQVGRHLVRDIDIKSDSYENVMIIQNYTLTLDLEKGWLLTVSGKGIKSLLSQRIVWTQTNLTGSIESSIRSVINNNCINSSLVNRNFTMLYLATSHGYTETGDFQLFGENIAEWLEEVCTTYKYGWKIDLRNIMGYYRYVFDLYKGVDRTYDQNSVTPVVFSPEFDNLLSSKYEYTKLDYKNAALIGGEGEGTSQRVTDIGSKSGINRYETYIDGSSVSSNGEIITEETYIKLLKSYGQTQLDQTAYTEKFSGEIDPNGLFKINVDYFLGDVVQIENEKGIKAKPRITEIIHAIDENGESIVPTFSEWEVV